MTPWTSPVRLGGRFASPLARLLAGVWFAVGCTTQPTLTGISLRLPEGGLEAGAGAQLVALGRYSDGSTSDLTALVQWRSSAPAIARLTGQPPGWILAVAPGDVQVSATHAGVEGVAPLRITVATEPILQAIAVTSPTVNLPRGATMAVQAMGTFSNSTARDVTKQVTWTVSDPTIASVADAGVVTGIAPGAATVIAVLGESSGSEEIAVTGPDLTAIQITPGDSIVSPGATEPLAATAVYSDQSTQIVTAQARWTSADPSSVTVSNASGSQGIATAVTSGTTTLSAEYGGMTGSTKMTVGTPRRSVTALALRPAMATVALGAKQAFTATALYSDGTQADVSNDVAWSSSSPAAGRMGVSGVTTAVSAGVTAVTASLGSIISPPSSLSVAGPRSRLASIGVAPNRVTLPPGGLQPFVATGTFSNAVSERLSSGVTWTSSDPSLVVVSSTGIATAVGTHGTARVAAALDGITSPEAELTLDDTSRELVSLALTPTASTLHVGAQQQLVAMGTYNDGSSEAITVATEWTTDAAPTATVSGTGVVSAVAPGTAHISAQVGPIASPTATVSVPAAPALIVSITLSPSIATLTPGTTQLVTATAIYNDGTTSTLMKGLTWSLTSPPIAAIDGDGLATALAAGSTGISANVGTVSSDVATLNVAPGPPELTAIVVSPALTTASIGGAVQFTAWGTYSDGSTRALTSGVSWRSGDGSRAAVSQSGLATALVDGESIISARAGVLTSAGAVLKVLSAPRLTSIGITPSSEKVTLNQAPSFRATGTYSDGSTAVLSSSVVWSSSAPSVAVINSQGVASPLTDGVTRVTATLGAVSADATLTISSTPPRLTSISVAPRTSHIPPGGTQQFTAIGRYDDHSTRTLGAGLSWSSSSEAVAALSPAGFGTAVAPGTALVTATLGATTSGPAVLVVNPDESALESITLIPSSTTVGAAGQTQFYAIGKYTNHTANLLSSGVVWTSFAPSVATILDGGLATALGTGTTRVVASFGAITSAPALLQIPAASPRLLSISLSPDTSVMSVGGTMPLSATGSYDDASTRDLTAVVRWDSDSPALAVIDSGGTVIGTGRGGASTGVARMNASLGSVVSTPAQIFVLSSACAPTINEVQPGPRGHEADEWVEIYNPCTSAVDLTGYTLQYVSAQGTGAEVLVNFGGSIPSQGFRVCGGADYVGANDCPLADSHAGSIAGYLSGVAGGLALIDSTGLTVVSSLGWGGAASNSFVNTRAAPWTDSTTYRSLIRYPDGQTTGDDSADLAGTTALTPGSPNIYIP